MGLIRILLAITVVFAHSPWQDGLVLVGGRNAVQMFYMISGFLIAHVIWSNPAYQNPIKFYTSRWLRLYPIYYGVAALSLIALLLGDKKFIPLYQSVPIEADLLLVLSNLLIVGQDWLLFMGVHQQQLIFTPDFKHSEYLLYQGLLVPQAWTLGVEITFYALAPFILRNNKILYTLLLGSLGLRAVLMWDGIGFQDPWTYRFFPCELALFLLGAVSRQMLTPWWARFNQTAPDSMWPRTMELTMLGLMLAYAFIPITETIKTPVLLTCFFFLLPTLFLKKRPSGLDSKLGEMSYPIYIGHLLIIKVLYALNQKMGIQDSLTVTLLNVAASVSFGIFLNEFFGKHVELIRHKLKARWSHATTDVRQADHPIDYSLNTKVPQRPAA